ncbi:hypothetical protein LTR91_002269 [Friedmanniomyces endolithicus]|uniref:C2H2-type domain-containing protein n=2 Tax=Friedmanniomyces endolithicus TaxID=329885 RepID=A0AAN6KZJ6_9PEZI|nr:hypothetical protein LTR73_005419 [Friedmanniomyces endolithicus]KAK0930857.1 hypothetical protein LTR57_001240 [Friedmanniomyces endolithicus]KAK1010985.1 hypothetical protein LTR91_002269 [Friedmanniomyces endolithicus]
MPPESITASDPDNKSADISKLDSIVGNAKSARSSVKDKTSTDHDVVGSQFPPPKTDKPRPHVCGTCSRSFARLEHLKRHERSHTKEKPFECPECTRCFARRDLLLRHQQKLHMTNPASSRPRTGRRESVSGSSVTGSAKVRKNSTAGGSANAAGAAGHGGHRPRANTISHIDLSTLGLLDGGNPHMNRMNALGIHTGHHMGMSGLAAPMTFDYRGMSNAVGNHGNLHGLPKLDMSTINSFDMSNSMRTAPILNSYGGFDLDQLFSSGNTVNPAQLHFGGPTSATSQFPNYEAFTGQHPMIPEGDDFGWMRQWNMQIQPGSDTHEQAVDESSPSHMSSGDSPAGYSEGMSHSTPAMPMANTNYQWSQPDMQPQQAFAATAPFQLDTLGTGLPTLDSPVSTVSPSHLNDPTSTAGAYFDRSLMPQNTHHPQQHHHSAHAHTVQSQMHSQNSLFFTPPSLSNFSSDSPSMSSSSMTGSARQSSVTSNSTDSITDATRQALLASLAQPSVFGHNHRKYSQPNVSSPLSPGAARNSMQGPNLPSTADIRRYVDAFIQFAHPHMPVVHIPTLAFDSPEYSSSIRGGAAHLGINHNSIVGGGGCLILAMAAIGALYEYDHPASKELFDAAKKLISLYLEERRKADMSAAVNGQNGDASSPHTPLWLVHAMLLNVIYGHQCGDKTAADIASTHCAALVSLARAAHLAQPPQGANTPNGDTPSEQQELGDVGMVDAGDEKPGRCTPHATHELDLHTQWVSWKTVEERKRTLFAIFILSSLLTTAYNQPPTIMNSEILLDLPCDEELWSAETAQEWQNRGGLNAAELNAVSFADALSTLLTANQRQGSTYAPSAYNSSNPLGALQAGDSSAENDLRPSTFGCLVLINALHNYIWETRTRHHGRQWTQQETDSMFSHIEPALNAWQAAWKANDHHKLERPNPFGLGPLSADSIPLLDLAFVRLFVNLGRSKEAFWQRDFDAMANELARGTEIVQHASGSPGTDAADPTPADPKSASGSPDNAVQRRASQAHGAPDHSPSSTRRERHLRKAAFYAADSLTIACSFNLTYADMTAHELPVQSAMCFFDCSQVLAEWASTVQERVGRYLGVLGRDSIDYTMVPAIMLLETEDVELLRKIERICESLEAKRFQQENLLVLDLQQMNAGAAGAGMGGASSMMHHGVSLGACGYGSKVLRITAMMLEKAVVWPVTHVMAKALETQANHMDQRAETSTTQ